MHFPQGPPAKHEVSIMQCSSKQAEPGYKRWAGADWSCPVGTSLPCPRVTHRQGTSFVLPAWCGNQNTLTGTSQECITKVWEAQQLEKLTCSWPKFDEHTKKGKWNSMEKTIYNTRSTQIYISHVVITWITEKDNTLRDNNMHKISWHLYFSRMYYFILLI